MTSRCHSHSPHSARGYKRYANTNARGPLKARLFPTREDTLGLVLGVSRPFGKREMTSNLERGRHITYRYTILRRHTIRQRFSGPFVVPFRVSSRQSKFCGLIVCRSLGFLAATACFGTECVLKQTREAKAFQREHRNARYSFAYAARGRKRTTPRTSVVQFRSLWYEGIM